MQLEEKLEISNPLAEEAGIVCLLGLCSVHLDFTEPNKIRQMVTEKQQSVLSTGLCIIHTHLCIPYKRIPPLASVLLEYGSV